MSVAETKSKPLDQSWIDAMTLRWKASERYLNGSETESLAEDHAIRILVKHDIPMLMKELTRLRPELIFA
jgi:hypothetical protein